MLSPLFFASDNISYACDALTNYGIPCLRCGSVSEPLVFRFAQQIGQNAIQAGENDKDMLAEAAWMVSDLTSRRIGVGLLADGTSVVVGEVASRIIE